MPCQHHFYGYSVDVGRRADGCQFNVPESSLLTLSDGQWCPFHLPMLDESGRPTPKSSWKKGEVDRFNGEVFSYINYAYKQHGPIDLTGVVFPGAISFQTLFTQERPSRHILFGGAEFIEPVDFQNCHFPWWLRFDEANFQAGVVFLSAAFKFVSFESARFSGETIFLWADFQGFADFKMAEFEGNAIFEGAIAGKRGRGFFDVTFEGVNFKSRATFNNRRFLNTVDYSKARFALAPEFHGCRLHQDTRFVGSSFDDVVSTHAPAAYRALKRAMGEIHARDLHATFYSLERKSTRNQSETPPIQRFFSDIYEFTSDFGQGVVRPLLGMVGVMGVFFLLNYLFSLQSSQEASLPYILQYTVEQIVRPFGVWSGSYNSNAIDWVQAALNRFPVLFRLVTSIHTMAFFVFFGLFILGLRRRLNM
jgi:hypothetical protein